MTNIPLHPVHGRTPATLPLPMRLPAILTTLLCGASLQISAHAFDFTFLSATNPTPNNAAEVVTYTKDGFRVGATFSDNTNADPNLHSYGAITYTMNASGALVNESIINFQPSFPAASVIQTAFDPMGRGFGVVTMSPLADLDVLGRVGFYSYRTGQIFGTMEVGFHPDGLTFSPDGRHLIVANEGEHALDFATSGKSTPGSLSVIDLSGIIDVSLAAPSQFTNLPIVTRDFSAVDISQARFFPGGNIPDWHKIEPESAVVVGSNVYVTLQENNAVGVFNIAPTLSQSNWVTVHGLGTITQTMDTSSVDGPGGTTAARPDRVVNTLPLPDAIAAYQVNGVTYYVTANEGDALTDSSDEATIATLKAEGKLDPSLTTGAGDITTNDKLGQLRVSRLDGDTDHDGDIDAPAVIGSRSFSIWRASDGALVYDSGTLETKILALDPTTHNINRTLASYDNRSTGKGPEPEALTLGVIDGRTYAVIGNERQNGILAFDITDPNNVIFDNDYFNALTDSNPANNFLLSPETVVFVDGADNPTGLPLFIIGHEGTQAANNTDGILVLSAQVPEPSTAALLILAAGVGLGRRSRRHARR